MYRKPFGYLVLGSLEGVYILQKIVRYLKKSVKFILIIEDTHFLRISDPVCFEVLEFIVIRNPGKG